MRVSHLSIRNFRNLKAIDIPLARGSVVVGENRSGKSNLIHAVRLVLDPTLTPRERELEPGDFSDALNPGVEAWDPMREGHVIEVSVELTDLEDDPAILAALGDALIEGEPMRARLTYRFAPEDAGAEQPRHKYAWTIVGGDEDNEVRWDVRRFLAHVHLPALRDAETELAGWRRSPLRPLLEAAASATDPQDLQDASRSIDEANTAVSALEEVQTLANLIGTRTEDLVGDRQALQTRLSVAPVDPGRLIRGLRLLIDGDAQRPLAAASLGGLNVLYLALLDLGLDARLAAEEIAHVVLTIEEPEAHLHPHVQRVLFESLLRGEHTAGRTVLVTTHSAHIVSVAEPQDLVVLRTQDAAVTAHAASTAELELEEWRDLRRYLDSTRSEMVFASRVVLVEGFAELVLMPRFAAALGTDLDRFGITVCAVHGTHFSTYVRFLAALEAPWVVITDGDPERRQTGAQRAAALVEALERPDDDPEDVGIFVGATTLERDIYDVSGDNRRVCLEALASERIPQADKNTIGDQLAADTVAMTSEDFLEIVSKAGKGSYAQRLAAQEQPLASIRQ